MMSVTFSALHTYFVSAEGVWVHNAAGTECERILALFRRVTDTITPGDYMAGYKYVRDKLPRMSEFAHRGVVDDVLKALKEAAADSDQSRLTDRLRTLGTDPLDGKFKETEAFGGYRFETQTGKTLRRKRPTDAGDPDFIDQNNQHWALKGPIPSQGNFDGFLESIRSHMTNFPNTGEKLIADVAGLSQVQIEAVKRVLSAWDSNLYKILE